MISVVANSISFSSADRSEKPGSTCLAWSLSRAVTVYLNELNSATCRERRAGTLSCLRRTFSLGTSEDCLNLAGYLGPESLGQTVRKAESGGRTTGVVGRHLWTHAQHPGL